MNRENLVPNSEIFSIGKDIERKNLSDFNESLKAEIRALGHQPIELDTNLPSPDSLGTRVEHVSRNTKDSSAIGPAIQSRLDYTEHVSFNTTIVPGSPALFDSVRVAINLCFAENIPGPPISSESEIQKALVASPDAKWQVPMYLSPPRTANDTVDFDAIVSTKLLSRVVADRDMLLYLIELSFEWVEDKHHTSLSREPPTGYGSDQDASRPAKPQQHRSVASLVPLDIKVSHNKAAFLFRFPAANQGTFDRPVRLSLNTESFDLSVFAGPGGDSTYFSPNVLNNIPESHRMFKKSLAGKIKSSAVTPTSFYISDESVLLLLLEI
ncbi:hypothetical protein AYI68_g6804 [Smittium mucronatum]|uniref:PIH1 N-terminal domain-containing protein n=1 Tax=Smittium mucronatum TaxID=133383 RepID=A0A1R0GQG5_9FUNG|nr:hypothetical protein AYI68_g6804 [Smittium mucronatum]